MVLLLSLLFSFCGSRFVCDPHKCALKNIEHWVLCANATLRSMQIWQASIGYEWRAGGRRKRARTERIKFTQRQSNQHCRFIISFVLWMLAAEWCAVKCYRVELAIESAPAHHTNTCNAVNNNDFRNVMFFFYSRHLALRIRIENIDFFSFFFSVFHFYVSAFICGTTRAQSERCWNAANYMPAIRQLQHL